MNHFLLDKKELSSLVGSRGISVSERLLCPPQNCGWALRFALLRIYVCPYVVPNSCVRNSSYTPWWILFIHTVTNLTWRWLYRRDFAMLQVLHELWDPQLALFLPRSSADIFTHCILEKYLGATQRHRYNGVCVIMESQCITYYKGISFRGS